ncbi:glycosyltransferase [Tabrizicola piscis]|nr:glycosyltransferase [Tabrizicola piscis]
MPSPLSISFVVPVYSGEDYLERLVMSVESIRDDWEREGAPVRLSELLLVDDAAIDGSPAKIDDLAAARPWIVALHLSRNYGQHAATIGGILHSSGDWVVTLDEDLQHPPERVEELLLHAVRHQCDVVYARPIAGKVHGKRWRDGSSRQVKRLTEWLTGTPTLHLVNSFRLIRGPIARATASVCTHNTYFDIALTWFTQRVSGIEMNLSDKRFMQTGRSGYNLKKLVVHAQKMLFSGQLRFLPLGLWIGAALFLFSVIAGIYVFMLRLFMPETISVEGWTSLFVAVCMSTGLISIMMGICLQYLSTLVLKAHGHPTFFTIDRSGDRQIVDWLENRTAIAERPVAEIPHISDLAMAERSGVA